MTQSNDPKAQVPFFVRYLEGQHYPEVASDVKAGIGGTQKHPTDLDEPHTLKYPSDGDDNPPKI